MVNSWVYYSNKYIEMCITFAFKLGCSYIDPPHVTALNLDDSWPTIP